MPRYTSATGGGRLEAKIHGSILGLCDAVFGGAGSVRDQQGNAGRLDLTRAQRAWIKERNACTSDECLVRVYTQQIEMLGQTSNAQAARAEAPPIATVDPDNPLPGFSLAMSVNRPFCARAGQLLREEIACRNSRPEHCQAQTEVRVGGKTQEAIKEVAGDYGYTGVYRSTAPAIGKSAVVYVDMFRGGRFPRLSETHIVNARKLAEILALAPDPNTQDNPNHARVDQDAIAREFASMLADGWKVADSFWPVVILDRDQMFLQYECPDVEYSEGDPYCPRVTAITLLKIVEDQEPIPFCHFEESNPPGPRSERLRR
jgi:uncharacterized protein